MASENETVADIVREMREVFNQSWWLVDREWAHNLADRIEAAHKHELEDCALRIAPIVRAETKAEMKKQTMEGNNAKMREALESVSKAFDDGLICSDYQMSQAEIDRLDAIYRQVKDFLSTPPRNCDVGTVEEQQRRRNLFCNKHPCNRCSALPVGDNFGIECFLTWAHMPYKEGENE